VKLLEDTIERGRDRFIREFSKLEAANDWHLFYSTKGVEERKQRLKYKALNSQCDNPDEVT
jgi:hypothetical protein